MAFTTVEKVNLRKHLGYLQVTAVQTFSAGGVPAPLETQFLIEGAMNQVRPEAEAEARRLLGVLDGIESQMISDLPNYAAEKVDEIGINLKEMDQLRREYLYWRGALANLLGVPANPFDFRFSGRGGGGFNVPVVG